MAQQHNSTTALIFMFLMGILFSCENQEEIPNPTSVEETQTKLTEDLLLIQSAKQYFEKEIENQSLVKSGLTARQSMVKYPMWHRSYIRHSKKVGKMVVVPLYFPEKLYIDKGEGEQKLSLSQITRLYIYQDKSGKTHSEVVTRIPDAVYWENPNQGFKGKVLIENWQGQFIRGYLLDGKLSKPLSAPRAGSKSDCITTYYYTCVDTPYSTYCSFNYSETVCSASLLAPPDPSGVGSGSGGGEEGGGENGDGTNDPFVGVEVNLNEEYGKLCPSSFKYVQLGEGYTCGLENVKGFIEFYSSKIQDFISIKFTTNLCITVNRRNKSGQFISKEEVQRATSEAFWGAIWLTGYIIEHDRSNISNTYALELFTQMLQNELANILDVKYTLVNRTLCKGNIPSGPLLFDRGDGKGCKP